MTYFWLFAALLLALLLDAVYRAVAADGRLGRRGAASLSGLVAVVVLLPLLPAWPYSAAPASVPSWFTSGARSLPAGSAALVYPLASSVERLRPCCGRPWRNMQFRSPAGSPSFRARTAPTRSTAIPPRSQAALAQCEGGRAVGADFPAADVRAQLRQWHTETVVVVPTAPGAACATALFTGALGPPHAGGACSCGRSRTARERST